VQAQRVLHVKINRQHFVARTRQRVGQVRRHGCFSHPTLWGTDTDQRHEAILSNSDFNGWFFSTAGFASAALGAKSWEKFTGAATADATGVGAGIDAGIGAGSATGIGAAGASAGAAGGVASWAATL